MRDKVHAVVACTSREKAKEYWDKLGGWRKGSKIPATVFDENGEEREGEERLEAWKEAFRKLGVDSIEDPDFDRGFAIRVEEEVQRMGEENEEKESEREMKEEMKENEDDDEETREEKRRKNEERSRNKLNREITQAEVSRAIDLLQNHKAAGQDGVIAEILKAGGEKIRKAVWMVCCVAWKKERVPIDWMQGVVFPLYKDGDDRDPMNYRGIAEHCWQRLQPRVGQQADVVRRKRETGNCRRARRISTRKRHRRSNIHSHRSFEGSNRPHHLHCIHRRQEGVRHGVEERFVETSVG